MPEKTKSDFKTPVNQIYLEAAVPLLSFGITGLGILLWQSGYRIEFQYFAIGCLISSCILAYLAWIRPKKDIVSLTTPIYAVIILFAPTEYYAGAVLQLVYGLSLTILLLRLKYRFGKPTQQLSETGMLPGPLNDYVEQSNTQFPHIPPELAKHAGDVFVRFARGDYHDASQLSNHLPKMDEGGTGNEPLNTAFRIVSEQAEHLTDTVQVPREYLTFAPEYHALCARPLQPSMDSEQVYAVTLDNALLLLYAAAWNHSPESRPVLKSLKAFAQKLLEE
jgi:hypothetical protein